MSSNPLPPADPDQVQRERTEQIARLNDETRQGKARRARILFTRGVVELLAEGQTEEPARTARVMINQERLMRQIANAPIDPGDDPYGERDLPQRPSRRLSMRIGPRPRKEADHGSRHRATHCPARSSCSTKLRSFRPRP